MKKKIFDIMERMGWNLFDNTYDDFDETLTLHYNRMKNNFDKLVEIEKDGHLTHEEELRKEDLAFMIDFIYAINELNNVEEKVYEKKMQKLAKEETYIETMQRLAKEDYYEFIKLIDIDRNLFYEENVDGNNTLGIQVFLRNGLMDEDEFIMSAVYEYDEDEDEYTYIGD